jgi:hypothetical protein
VFRDYGHFDCIDFCVAFPDISSSLIALFRKLKSLLTDGYSLTRRDEVIQCMKDVYETSMAQKKKLNPRMTIAEDFCELFIKGFPAGVLQNLTRLTDKTPCLLFIGKVLCRIGVKMDFFCDVFYRYAGNDDFCHEVVDLDGEIKVIRDAFKQI